MTDIAGVGPDKKLTLEAKEAIRAYLIKIFVPSTVTMTIIAGFTGYTIKDLAQKEAVETALSKATDFTNQLQTKAITEADSIHQAKIEIDQYHETEKTAAESAKSYLQQQQQLSQKDYGALAKQLLTDDNFRQSLVKVDITEISKIDDRLAHLEKFASDLRNASGGSPGNGQGSASQCPSGSYAVGFLFQDEGGLAHGALWAGTITCRSFSPNGS